MTANDIKILAEKNRSDLARDLTLGDLEEIADVCEMHPITQITNALVVAYQNDELDEFLEKDGEK